jgi:hypothetical protein
MLEIRLRPARGHISLIWLSCLAAALLAVQIPEPAAAQDEGHDSGVQRAISFSGFDFAKDSSSYYSGGILALNKDLSRDGFVLRLMTSSGDFEYEQLAVPGGNVDGDEVSVDAMIGYQATIGLITATAYAGYEYRDIELSPNDPENTIRGTESGFKIAFEAETSDEIPLFAAVDADYSTAFEAWNAMLRLGYNMGRLVLGAEGSVSGVENEESQRLGGFITYRFNLTPSMPAELTADVGHQFVDNEDAGEGNTTSGGEGTYAGAGLSFSF